MYDYLKRIASYKFFPNLLLIVILSITLLSCTRVGGIYMIGCLLFITLMIITIRKKLRFDNIALLILLFSFLTFIFSPLSNVSAVFTLYFTVSPVCFYLYGKYIVKMVNDNNHIIDFYLLISFCFCFFAISKTSEVFTTGRLLGDSRLFELENGETVVATAIGLFVCPTLAGLSSFLYMKKDTVRRLLIFALFFMGLLTVLSLTNRAGVIVSLISVFIVSLFCSDNKKSIFLAGILFVTIVYILMKSGLISQDLIDAYSARNESDLDTGGGRLERWELFPSLMINNPFGWASSETVKIGYMHNMWLDIGRDYGLVPFLIFLVITYKTFKDIYFIGKNLHHNSSVFLLSINTCLYLSALDEPFIQSNSLLYLILIMTMGVTRQYRIYIENEVE